MRSWRTSSEHFEHYEPLGTLNSFDVFEEILTGSPEQEDIPYTTVHPFTTFHVAELNAQLKARQPVFEQVAVKPVIISEVAPELTMLQGLKTVVHRGKLLVQAINTKIKNHLEDAGNELRSSNVRSLLIGSLAIAGVVGGFHSLSRD